MAAAGDLRAFFEFVIAKSGASVVHLIAHSMGNPLMIETLKQLQSKPDWADLHIGQIILAAPDMDAAEFATAIPSLRNVVTGITLYASASDKALVVSQLVNGGRGHRAGFVTATQGPVVVDGVDAIDVTAASMDILSLNHSAYAENAVLLEDMKKVLHGVRPPDIREPSMQHMNVGTRAYWHYQPRNP
jgi:esterase/lipase superfamily enzyme